VLSALNGRLSNRLARHFRAAPHRLQAHAPMVSFTFDDAPDSAAGEGAALLEAHGGLGTFYLAGSLIDQPGDFWRGLSNDAIVRLHRGGHEIGCHTFSHAVFSDDIFLKAATNFALASARTCTSGKVAS